MRRLTTVAPLVLAVAALVGCGGEEGAGTAATERTAQDDALATRMLVEQGDLGAGWTQDPQKSDPEDTPCDVDSSDMTVTGQAITRSFSSGQIAAVISDATVFESEDQASDAFARLFEDESRECFANELAKEFTAGGSDDDVTVGDVQVEDLGPAEAGDEDDAFRLRVPLQGQGVKLDLFIDVRAVRDGRGIGLLAFTRAPEPFDERLEHRLVEAVAARGAG